MMQKLQVALLAGICICLAVIAYHAGKYKPYYEPHFCGESEYSPCHIELTGPIEVKGSIDVNGQFCGDSNHPCTVSIPGLVQTSGDTKVTGSVDTQIRTCGDILHPCYIDVLGR